MPLTSPSINFHNWSRNDDHPHPLRSHCATENIVADSVPEATTSQDSITIRRHLLSRRRDSFHIIPPLPQAPAKAFTHSSPERFIDAAGAPAGTPDFEVIPVRPPLRPTVSHGSASDVSYYSPTASEFGKKSASVSVEEMSLGHEPSGPRPCHDWRYYATFACLAVLNFSCDLSTTVLATALPDVSDDLGLNTLQAFWIPGSLLLSAALLQPFFMRLAHAFGCKALLLFGIAIFMCGSATSALATTTTSLFAGQCLQGTGSGGIRILTELTLGQLKPNFGSQPAGRRAWGRSASHLFRFGLALGPILGGACAQTIGWRYAFLMQVLCSTIGLVGLPFLLRLARVEARPLRDRITKIDFIGWILLTAAVSLMTTSIFCSGLTYSWSSYHTWVPLSMGFTCLTLWCLYNGYHVEPILPVSIFKDRSAAVSCYGAGVHGVLLAAITYLMPISFQVTGMQPVMSGLSLAPWTLAIVALSIASGAIISMAGYRPTAWTGWTLAATGCGLMVLFSGATTAILVVPVGIFGGAGLGLLTSSLIVTVEAAASTDDESIHAAPLFTYCNTVGQSVGVLAGGSIFFTAMDNSVASNKYLSVGAATYIPNAISFIKEINTTTLEPQGLQSALVSVYTQSLRYVWIFTCAIAALAFVLSVGFTRGPKKPGKVRRSSTPMLPELEG